MVFLLTTKVVIGNFAEVAVAFTVTVEGTAAFVGLLLDKLTTTPFTGAGAVSVTVPTALALPMTLEGFKVSEDSAGDGRGRTVKPAVFVTPEQLALILPRVVTLTTEVIIGKLAEDEPAATVARGGMLAAEFTLVRFTTVPPVGAGPVKLTAPVADCPPMTLEGVRVNAFNTAGPPVEGL